MQYSLDEFYHWMALIDACKYCRGDVVTELLKHYTADVYAHPKIRRPFECAVSYGNEEAIVAIVNHFGLSFRDQIYGDQLRSWFADDSAALDEIERGLSREICHEIVSSFDEFMRNGLVSSQAPKRLPMEW